MRVQLWCDMEGIAGICKWDQVNHTGQAFEEGRRLYTGEINAAVRGAKKAGATEIIVVDGHGAGGDFSCNSWIKDKLEPGAEYLCGYRWGCYVEVLQDGADAMLLPGAHAMAGTPDGVLCHTMSSEQWVNASFNGVKVGESGIIAAIAGSFGVPCVFVSGDTATCREVADLVGPSIVQAPVKRGLGRFSARTLSHADACDLIEEKVFQALSNPEMWPFPYKVDAPVEFKVEFRDPDQTVPFQHRPGIEIPDPRTIISRADSAWLAWDQFWPRK